MKTTPKQKFDRVLAGKGKDTKNGITVENIWRDLFLLNEEKNWKLYEELLKTNAQADIKNEKSIMCFLCIYWFRYEEQQDIIFGSRPSYNGIFFNDMEIEKIIFTEGEQILDRIKKGMQKEYDLEYLLYTTQSIANLQLNKEKSIFFLRQILKYCYMYISDEKKLWIENEIKKISKRK